MLMLVAVTNDIDDISVELVILIMVTFADNVGYLNVASW